MDQIHRRVGFEKIAPDPVRRMRRAGNQQHPQPVADALDGNRGAVVAVGHLPLGRRHPQLDDIRPRMGEWHAQGFLRADLRSDPGGRPAIDPDFDLHRLRPARRRSARSLHHEGQFDALAQDAEIRCLPEHEIAVIFTGPAGDQGMHRPRETRQQPGVMDPSVRHQNRAGGPPGHDLTGGRLQGSEEPCAVLAGRAGLRPHHPILEIPLETEGLEGFCQSAFGRGGLLRPLIDTLARTVINDHEHHIGEAARAPRPGAGDSQVPPAGPLPPPPASASPTPAARPPSRARP